MEIIETIIAVILFILMLSTVSVGIFMALKYLSKCLYETLALHRAKTLTDKLNLIHKWESKSESREMKRLKKDIFSVFKDMIREFPDGPKGIEVVQSSCDTHFPYVYNDYYMSTPPFIKCGAKYIDILKDTLIKEGLQIRTYEEPVNQMKTTGTVIPDEKKVFAVYQPT